ncbi:MAG: hypothetical protein GQ577_12645 [Woeseiaceae bacterium]|nr:hypothetical protein [Woeseiaceae bacterium]
MIETAGSRNDGLDASPIFRKQRDKRGIASGRIRQFADIGLELLEVVVWVEIQDADGDLGLKRVGGTAGTRSRPRSAMPGGWGVTAVRRIGHKT